MGVGDVILVEFKILAVYVTISLTNIICLECARLSSILFNNDVLLSSRFWELY